MGVLGKFSLANSLTKETRLSGLLMDFTLWPIPIISFPSFLVLLTNSMGMRPESKASVNMLAAPSKAPPNLSPIVSNPETKEETKSFPALEPEQGQDAPDAHVLTEDLGNGYAGVEKLLATLVANACHEVGRLPDETKLSCPVVVHRDGCRGNLGLGHNDTRLNQAVVDGSDLLAQFVEGGG